MTMWKQKTEAEIEQEADELYKQCEALMVKHPQPITFGEALSLVRGVQHSVKILCEKISEVKTKVALHEARIHDAETVNAELRGRLARLEALSDKSVVRLPTKGAA